MYQRQQSTRSLLENLKTYNVVLVQEVPLNAYVKWDAKKTERVLKGFQFLNLWRSLQTLTIFFYLKNVIFKHSSQIRVILLMSLRKLYGPPRLYFYEAHKCL